MKAKSGNRHRSRAIMQKSASATERFRIYSDLLDFYISAGGTLAPERDSQSPFNFDQYYREASCKNYNLRMRG
jgi:hypothetical protein